MFRSSYAKSTQLFMIESTTPHRPKKRSASEDILSSPKHPKKDFSNSDKVTIRLYEIKDREAVQQIIVAGLEAKEDLSKIKMINAHLKRYDTECRNHWTQFNNRFWVAVSDEQIIGCAGILVTRQQRLNDKEMVTLHHLSVLNERRRQGIGTLLMDKVENYCEEQKIKSINLTTQINLESAQAFYEKRGYKITSNARKVETEKNHGLIKYKLNIHFASSSIDHVVDAKETEVASVKPFNLI